MNIGLVAPAGTSCRSNAGAHLLTAGIRWLIRQAVPGARFVTVEMLRDDPAQWSAAMTCDALVLCGNPRFSAGDADAWWEHGIWDRLVAAQLAGIPVIDAWAGACLGLDAGTDLDADAARLEAIPRVRSALAHAGVIRGRITRDALAQRVYERAGLQSELLPCSSWWAHRELDVHAADEPVDLRPYDAIVLLGMAGHAWMPAALRRLQATIEADDASRPCLLLATTWSDLLWARGAGLNTTQLVSDPASLLRTYAQCRRVASLRIHASIPAASVGCAVATLGLDTRALACAPFRLTVTPFTALHELDAPLPFAYAEAPDAAPAITTLRTLLC